jgi:outer membrane protein OmpA-like peptidoglycan-associated protein
MFFLVTTLGFSQNRNIKNADSKYDELSYMDAVEIYTKVAEKGYGNQEIYQRLGNSYYFNGDYSNAAKWYTELFKNSSNESIDAEYYYRYSQTLKSINKTKEANNYLELFSKMQPNDPRSLAFNSDKNYLDEIDKVSNRYAIEEAGVNTDLSDYGGTFYEGNLIFTSSRKNSGLTKNIHSWTNQPFSKLYSSPIDSLGKLGKVELFDKMLDTKYNEASAVFTKDGKTVYFTRNNYNNGKKGKDSEDVILLKLYKAKLVDGKWEDVEELPFNSDAYNCAHPALSTDNKTLYFVSNMPGTLGASDIFKVTINEDGSFGNPINLGSTINTPGRETFPFISESNELYFASDGLLGLGGLDVFAVKLQDDGSYSKIYNVGKPINSEFDDFAYLINSNTKYGFFSSNRSTGVGYDDIYRFKEDKLLPFDCEQKIEGIVTDVKTGVIIANAKVTLFDKEHKEISTTTSDEKGYYSFEKVDSDSNFYIKVATEEFDINEINVTTPQETGTTKVDISLEKRFIPINTGDDLAKIYNIENIYFDLDKWAITKKAEVKLNILLSVMELHPQLKIDVRSHTDCRQTIKYNEILSDKRAKSTMAWLIKKGIDKSRLTGKGYGETQLVNDCGCEPTNKSDCNEAQHQANRRSEFIVQQ